MTGKHAVLGMAMAGMLFVSAFPAYAKLIKDSYIVMFKQPAANEQPLIEPPNRADSGKAQVPFGEHSTGQSKAELAAELNLKSNQVVSIYETINAVHLNITEDEAHRLSLDDRVLYVEQDQTTILAQNNPGWALDRLDEVTPVLDYTYNETQYNGAGRTIYVLDSGLALKNANVAAEFAIPGGGSRAEIFADFNFNGDYPEYPEFGDDCFDHGTPVAVALAGNTYGVARGATLKIVKITMGCGIEGRITNSIQAFNWLAQNAPPGTIVNWSNGLWNDCLLEPSLPCPFNDVCYPKYDSSLDSAIRACHNAGIIVVVAAGNDGCNTASFSPTYIPEAFVVGATSQNRIQYGQDDKASFSRYGSNISGFAPGENVLTLSKDGVPVSTGGTSLATAYVSGLFATGCQAAGTFCDTAASAAPIYEAMRNTGTLDTVTCTGGIPSIFCGITSRFLSKKW